MKMIINPRPFYYGTVLPLIGLIVLVRADSIETEAMAEETMRVSNRQISVMSSVHVSEIERVHNQYAKEIQKLAQEHKLELGECISFYEQALNEANMEANP